MKEERYSTIKRQSTTHVTYIMLSSFRVLDNHGLHYAISNYETCNIIVFRVSESERQDEFFDSFIHDSMNTLSQFGHVKLVNDLKNITLKNDIVIDKGYMREHRDIEEHIKLHSQYTVTSVESNVVVPVSFESQKEEYSARTIRPKIFKHLYAFIDPVLDDLLITSIEKKAINEFNHFVNHKLQYYHLKNHPEFDYTSGMSVYLKYGIISPIRLLIILERANVRNKESFIEELVVRRELSYNFIYYNPLYDNFNHITYPWAYQTMEVHQFDNKKYLYSIDDYINFRTHDKYFNTAMKEMVLLGKMHGYMRMYWCKKIIEWSPNFKYAYDTAIYLNNHYFLDGNTPNGYTGVAWCFGKHDRAWKERLIFGKLRYMNANGLKRKFDIENYIIRIESEVKVYESSKTNNLD